MADVLTWLADHANLAVDAALVLLATDRWVHRRELSEADHNDRLDQLEQHDREIKADMREMNEQASSRYSQIMGKLNHIELDIREMQTVLRLRRRESRN